MTFSQQCFFNLHEPLFVKLRYQEVVKLHSYKMDGMAAGTNVTAEFQGMSLSFRRDYFNCSSGTHKLPLIIVAL